MGLWSENEMRKASEFSEEGGLNITYYVAISQHLLGNDTNMTGRTANVIKTSTSLNLLIAAVRTQSTILSSSF